MTTTQQPEAPPSWTGDTDVDSALIMLDRIDCSHDDDARINAVTATLRSLHARVVELECRLEIDPSHSIDGISARDSTIKLQDDRIAQLESQLVKEAGRTAEEKLRADQMEHRHKTQAALNSDARNQLSALTTQLEAIGAGGVETLRKSGKPS